MRRHQNGICETTIRWTSQVTETRKVAGSTAALALATTTTAIGECIPSTLGLWNAACNDAHQ